jgi:hypothetical protein
MKHSHVYFCGTHAHAHYFHTEGSDRVQVYDPNTQDLHEYPLDPPPGGAAELHLFPEKNPETVLLITEDGPWYKLEASGFVRIG